MNATTLEAVAPFPPQVAFTVKVPPTQAELPPGTEMSVKLPLVGLGNTSLMSATAPEGFFTVTITAVLGPGTGVIVPVIVIGCAPVYEAWSVLTVSVYVAAA